jgi:hypothetical protein
MCCCGGSHHHGSCHAAWPGPYAPSPWRAPESLREEYRRTLEEERELLERRLRLLDRELEDLRGGSRPGEERA